jgi:hypothetical protein
MLPCDIMIATMSLDNQKLQFHYTIMGSPTYMWSIIDPKVINVAPDYCISLRESRDIWMLSNVYINTGWRRKH